jgi:hypothetical protein
VTDQAAGDAADNRAGDIIGIPFAHNLDAIDDALAVRRRIISVRARRWVRAPDEHCRERREAYSQQSKHFHFLHSFCLKKFGCPSAVAYDLTKFGTRSPRARDFDSLARRAVPAIPAPLQSVTIFI